MPVPQVHVGIDQAREDRPSIGLDDGRASWHLHLSPSGHRRDAVSRDDDQRILDRGAAGAIDQRAALKHEYGLLGHGDPTEHDDECRERQ